MLRLLRVPWTAWRSNQSILKEISPGCSLEGHMLKLNSSTLATSCKELTHWKRPWCWEGLGAGGEGDNRGWDGCMTSPTRWTWMSLGKLQELVMDRATWCAAIHGVTKSRTWLSNWTELKLFSVVAIPFYRSMGFPGGSDGKESTCNVGDLGLIPGLGRSAGESSWTEESGGLYIVHVVTKSQTKLSD